MKANILSSRNVVIAIFITAILIFLTIPKLSNAQTIYGIAAGPDVSIKVLGTSNVHDWTMTSATMSSQGAFKVNAEKELTGLSDFSFSIDAKTLKSEHSSMDTRTYKAIKADEFPKIIYKLSSAVVTTVSKNKYLIKTNGNLSIAGVTQAITMDVDATVNADNSITCTGSEKLKLTDFKIDPPSFMLGTMKVYNDLTIQFTVNYKK